MSIISSREHAIFSKRSGQMRLNFLAAHGGRDYVDARLWRAPNETDASWGGIPESGIVGRKTRTANVNDAGRVASKINQYIFSKNALREGADEVFLANCTGDGESVNEFMQRVNLAITCGRWCWIQVDRAPLSAGVTETLANKAPVKWTLWDALDIPDWHIGENGEIEWLIVRSNIYDNSDPHKKAQSGKIHTLYERKDGKVYITEECDLQGISLRTNEALPGLTRIPFVCVGRPSDKAWWFDDVENIQAQVLNLDSQHNETLTETVYPQLVAPSSIGNSLEVRLAEKSVNGEKVAMLLRELAVGRKVPIMEDAEDKGITRYLVPGGDLKLLAEEAERKRRTLFDIAGLALFNRESRQVQTAESKRFDQMDTNATLGNRALLLQEAEHKAVELSVMFDKSFKSWESQYNTSFDVVDVASLGEALTLAANVPDKTPTIRKIIAKVQVKLLKEAAAGVVPEEDIEDAIREIDEKDFSDPEPLPNPFEGMKKLQDGDDDED